MSSCPACGSRDYLCQQCKMDELEDRLGLPSDHFDADAGIVCWVQSVDETWHASMYFEGTRHVAACGETFETPVADVRDDPRRLADTHTCDDCEAALEADDEETVPDGGEFEPASELRADGGLPGWAERVEDSVRCTVCGNQAPTAAEIDHDCIYQNDLVADGGEVDVYQWVLETVHEYPAATDSRWGCRRNLVHQGRKLDGVTKDDVEEAIARAVDNEDLISWNGLLARAEVDRLREITRAEHEDHEITRGILVGKCNKLIAKKKREQTDEAERELRADGGRVQSTDDTAQKAEGVGFERHEARLPPQIPMGSRCSSAERPFRTQTISGFPISNRPPKRLEESPFSQPDRDRPLQSGGEQR